MPTEGPAGVPASRADEDEAGPAPMGLDLNLPLEDVPSRDEPRDDRTPDESSSGSEAILDLSPAVFLAAIAYQACWIERRVRDRAGRGRDAGRILRRSCREDFSPRARTSPRCRP